MQNTSTITGVAKLQQLAWAAKMAVTGRYSWAS